MRLYGKYKFLKLIPYLKQELFDILQRVYYPLRILCLARIITQMVFRAVYGIAFIPDEVEDNLQVLNIFQAEKPVAFFVLFGLKYREFLLIKTQQRLLYIKHGRNLAHGVVHFL